MNRKHLLPAPEDTHALGRALADVLRAGDLVVLVGPLGAGKTALTRGIGAGLGVREPVTSPTFVIARVHSDGRVPLVHVDAYRLGGVAEVDDLDLDASLDESVTIVEWGEGKVEQLADAHLVVRIERGDDDVRVVELVGIGVEQSIYSLQREWCSPQPPQWRVSSSPCWDHRCPCRAMWCNVSALIGSLFLPLLDGQVAKDVRANELSRTWS